MELEETYSIELDNQPPLSSNFSSLPTNFLDWMENHLQVAFIIWDQLEQICYVTQSIKDLIGFEKEELIGIPWYERLQPLEPRQIEQYLHMKSERGMQVELLNKNNDMVYVELHVAYLEEPVLERKFVVAAIKDLTVAREVKDLTMQAEKMTTIGQLSASIAHEIRNPLTSIKGFLQLLQAGVNHKDEYYRIMEDEIEKIEAITSELLFMSKPSKHEMQNEYINDLMQDVIVLLQSQAKLNDITIEIREPITDMIYCDRSRIKQVFINLIKNAIEAMDEPGKIEISSHSDELHTIVDVKDEGKGIPKELIEQLDVAFFTTKEYGTGLGLSITKEILQEHGGRLNILNNEGKGSTFQLIFPRVTEK